MVDFNLVLHTHVPVKLTFKEDRSSEREAELYEKFCLLGIEQSDADAAHYLIPAPLLFDACKRLLSRYDDVIRGYESLEA